MNKVGMNSDEFQDYLLLCKEHWVKKLIEIGAKVTKVNKPKLIFWDGFCPGSSNEDLAHIHLNVKYGQICFSRQILKGLNLDELEDTALHELTHLFVKNHGAKFENTLSKIKETVWHYKKKHPFTWEIPTEVLNEPNPEVPTTNTELEFRKVFHPFLDKYRTLFGGNNYFINTFETPIWDSIWAFPNVKSELDNKEAMRKAIKKIFELYEFSLKEFNELKNWEYKEELEKELIIPLKQKILEVKQAHRKDYLKRKIEKIESKVEEFKSEVNQENYGKKSFNKEREKSEKEYNELIKKKEYDTLKNKKISQNSCSYHLCAEAKGLEKCPYCKEKFCNIHVFPKPPSMPPYRGSGIEQQEAMELWRTSGHPCIPYASIYWANKVDEDDKFLEILDALKGRKKINYEKIVTPPKTTTPILISDGTAPEPPKIIHRSVSALKLITIIVILSAIVIAFLFQPVVADIDAKVIDIFPEQPARAIIKLKFDLLENTPIYLGTTNGKKIANLTCGSVGLCESTKVITLQNTTLLESNETESKYNSNKFRLGICHETKIGIPNCKFFEIEKFQFVLMNDKT